MTYAAISESLMKIPNLECYMEMYLATRENVLLLATIIAQVFIQPKRCRKNVFFQKLHQLKKPAGYIGAFLSIPLLLSTSRKFEINSSTISRDTFRISTICLISCWWALLSEISLDFCENILFPFFGATCWKVNSENVSAFNFEIAQSIIVSRLAGMEAQRVGWKSVIPSRKVTHRKVRHS